MALVEPRPPVQPGEPAPDFTLPSATGEGTLSLADYRGRSPVLLALFRGVFCAFCRRGITQLASSREKLRDVGVETLGVVASQPERARLYFRFHPARVPLAADPERATHRAYGLPSPVMTPEMVHGLKTTPINPGGELPEALPILEAVPALDRLDRFEETEVDVEERRRQAMERAQLCGHFLVDREGIVRWIDLECDREGLAGIGKYPSDEELLVAAKSLLA
jgi:peroxiredoxin